MRRRYPAVVALGTIVVSMLVLAGCASTPRFTRHGTTVKPSHTFSESSKSKSLRGADKTSGYASYYGPGFNGKKTASGERFDMHELTAAHRTLPFGTRVRVTNIKTGLSVVVRINDRGPFVRNRIIDVSLGAAKKIALVGVGTTKVLLEVLR